MAERMAYVYVDLLIICATMRSFTRGNQAGDCRLSMTQTQHLLR